MSKTITISKARFAAIIKHFGRPLGSDGFVLSLSFKDCVGSGTMDVHPADGADGPSTISYIAYEPRRPIDLGTCDATMELCIGEHDGKFPHPQGNTCGGWKSVE